MAMERANSTRRNFILASSAQAVFAFDSNISFSQTPAPVLSEAAKEVLDRLLSWTRFVHAGDLSEAFDRLWKEKVELTLAVVTSDAEQVISDLVTAAQNALIKEFGEDKPIPHEKLQMILAGTIYVQNIIFAKSTDVKAGIVDVTRDSIQSMKDYYCSFYPYCK
jgi:hypothetical protein